MIVLDTHALIWLECDDRRLGRKSRRLIEKEWANGEVAVCAISFWEVALLQSRNRVVFSRSIEEWRSAILEDGIAELALNGVIGIRAVEFGELPQDPADRLIVATTVVHRAELMTADERLLSWRHDLVRHDARL